MAPGLFKRFSLIVFALLAMATTYASFAYASSNTFYPTSGGDGLGSISGYVIGDVSYHLASDPSRLDSVSFSLNADADFARIQLTDTQSGWYPCTNTEGNQWTCDANVSLSAVNQLRVIAGEH
jgi:hypothetical protein